MAIDQESISINVQKVLKQIEECRGRPLICYVTSDRPGAQGTIQADVIPEFIDQVAAIPSDAKSLDLLIVSHGGDPNVAARIVSLIREKVDEFRVLIPRGAFSAATLVALGADHVYMHPCGNLGPVDLQINAPFRRPDGTENRVQFGSEDLAAFVDYARATVGLSDQANLLRVFEKFIDAVGPVPIGIAARAGQHSVFIGEQLLRRRAKKSGGSAEKSRAIVERLTKKFFHHGYAVSRHEASEIGLNVEKASADLDRLLDDIWTQFETLFENRDPFNPVTLLRENPSAAPLFSEVPMLNLPSNLPLQLLQPILQQAMQKPIVFVPPTPYNLLSATLESSRLVSTYRNAGLIFANRRPDMQINWSMAVTKAGWTRVPIKEGVSG